MQPYYLSPRFSDYTLIVSRRRVPVHRNVLARIPYFDRLFDFPQERQETELEQIEFRYLDLILRFVYGVSDSSALFSKIDLLDGQTAARLYEQSSVHPGDKCVAAIDALEQTERFLYREFQTLLEERVHTLIEGEGPTWTGPDLDETERRAMHRLLRYLHDREPSPVAHPFSFFVHSPNYDTGLLPLRYNLDLLVLCEADLVAALIHRRRYVKDHVLLLAWMVVHPDDQEGHKRLAEVPDRTKVPIATHEREVVLTYRGCGIPAAEEICEKLLSLPHEVQSRILQQVFGVGHIRYQDAMARRS